MSRTKEWMLSQGLSMAAPDYGLAPEASAVPAEHSEAAPAVSEIELESLGQLHMAVWDDQEEEAA